MKGFHSLYAADACIYDKKEKGIMIKPEAGAVHNDVSLDNFLKH